MISRLGRLVCLIGAAACASSGGAAASRGSGNSNQWMGNFKPAASAVNASLAPATPNRGTGTVTVTAVSATPARSSVELSINAGAGAVDQVAWQIFSGACGSPGPSVAGESQFPPISVSSTGDGHIRMEMPFALDKAGTYHVNVYWTPRANDMNDVMMCANLQPGG
ncbi:MAG TPA: hypothetical protein VGJ18_24035 [Gemmatimonadaceae bacterium]